MRTFASAVLGLLAVLLAAAAFCGAWLNTNVVSDDGFAALGQPLATDEAFQSELNTAVSTEATAAVNVPAPLSGFVQPVIASAMERVQTLPEYPQAWTETLRRSHAETFADGGADAALDVAPLVQLVTGAVGSELNVDIPAPESAPVQLGSPGRSIQDVRRAGEAWPVLALAAGVAAILALLVARRRSTTLALMGLGLGLAGAGIWLAAGILPGRVAERQFESPVAATFANAFTERAAQSLQTWTLGLILAAAAALVVGLLIRVLRGSRR